MAFRKNLIFRRFNSLINPKTLQNHATTPHSLNFKSPLSSSQQPQTEQNKKSLFTEVMSGKTTTIDIEEGNEGEDTELKQITQKVRSCIEKTINAPKEKSLYAAFTNKPANCINQIEKTKHVKKKVELKSLYAAFSNHPKNWKPLVVKDLSPDMVIFLKFLYEKGYFDDTDFTKGWGKFDLASLEAVFARQYIKFAVRRFAKDNQEISKWLSVSALKQVAVFGCPSTIRSIVFPAKVLRRFFEVPENTVCSKCVLRESCKFMNKSVWGHPNKLDMGTVMKVITPYALQWVHPEMVVSDEVNKAVSQLLKEFVKLSQTT